MNVRSEPFKSFLSHVLAEELEIYEDLGHGRERANVELVLLNTE